MRRPSLTRFSLLAVTFAAATFFQCDGSEKPDGDPDTSTCEGALPGGVVYPDEKKASDEALVRVWEARCRAPSDPSRAFVLAAPENGAVVPADVPVEIRWEKAAAHGRLLPFHFGVGRALAHMPPITGDVWLVELSPADGGDALHVFTGDTAWTPDDAQWSRLVEMREVRVKIWNAHLEKGVIFEASDGPFVSPTIGSFTIEAP